MRDKPLVVLLSLALTLVAETSRGQTALTPARELYQKAQIARNQQKWQEAFALYRQALEARGAERYAEEALYWAAYCQQQLRNYERALELYSEYAERYPRGKYAPIVEARFRTLAKLFKTEEEASTRARELARRAEELARRSAVMALTRNAGFQDVPLILDLVRKETHPALRVVLVTSLGRIQDPELVPQLETIALYDSSIEVRRAAVDALARIGDPAAALAIVKLVNDAEEKEIIHSAIPALGKFDAELVAPTLLRVARSAGDPGTRALAIHTISTVRGADAYLDSLYQIALDCSDSPHLLRESITALARLSAKGSRRRFWTPARLERLSDLAVRDTTGNSLIAFALLLRDVDAAVWGQFSESYFRKVTERAPDYFAVAVLPVFQKRGAGRVRPQALVNLLARPDLSEPNAIAILQYLDKHYPTWVNVALAKLIQAHKPGLNLGPVARAVSPSRALECLAPELQSDDAGWRAEVVNGLGAVAHHDMAALQLLIRTAETDPDPTVRREAFRQLTQIDNPQARETVRRMVREFYR